ncbi:MAG TPA: TIGR03619 family F420-dependent LLM class oxidoreductase [Acidimicrobiales bacterium]
MPGLSLSIAGLHRSFGPELDHYLDVARVADEVGIDQVVLADHVVMGNHTEAYPYGEFPFAPDEPWAEPLTLLTAIAAVTSRVRLGTGILITPLRTPAALAKTVATLDALSGGRVDLGVGVGWQREEYDVAGVPWAERWGRLDDGLRACRVLWSDAPASFASPSVCFDDIWCAPRPTQARLPVWLGAKATDRNCARVADWGDGWMPLEARTGPDELFEGIARLRSAFVAAGRAEDELLVRAGVPFVRGDDGVDFGASRDAALRLVDAGVTHFSVNLRRSVESAAGARGFLEQLAEGLLPLT